MTEFLEHPVHVSFGPQTENRNIGRGTSSHNENVLLLFLPPQTPPLCSMGFIGLFIISLISVL